MKSRRPRKRSIILCCFIVLILAILGGGFYLWYQINQPEVASLQIGRVTNSADNYDISLNPVTKTGQYVSFEYPSGMTARDSEIGGPQLETYTYVAKDVQSWILAVSVSNLPNGDLQNSSSYMLRKNNPSEYAESQETINDQQVILMTDQTASGFSEVAYLQHGAMLATVALSGDHETGTQPLQATFAMVLNSWKWLN